jgi:hypothetical protein
MRKLAVLHFSPIERYPPVINWLNFLADTFLADPKNAVAAPSGFGVRVFSLRAGNDVKPFAAPAANIRITRPGRAGKKGIFAYLNYGLFHVRTLLQLIKWRPDTVLYYETLSSFPAIFYKKFINRRASLFIHYHEYASPKEYREGMVLARWFHRLEKKIYPLAAGISHTNTERTALFKNDLEGIALPSLYVLPNYPPASWRSAGRKRELAAGAGAAKIKIIYVGAISLDTMYTKELAQWVSQQGGRVLWDIYSDNFTPEARTFLESFDKNLIRFRKGVNYDTLPGILPAYDIGVILYNGHIPNYIYNAPNKLFEYMACGLDIWFPDVMLGCYPFKTTGTYPKTIAVDFSDLSHFDLPAALDHTGLRHNPSVYYAEDVLPELLFKMNNANYK